MTFIEVNKDLLLNQNFIFLACAVLLAAYHIISLPFDTVRRISTARYEAERIRARAEAEKSQAEAERIRAETERFEAETERLGENQ